MEVNGGTFLFQTSLRLFDASIIILIIWESVNLFTCILCSRQRSAFVCYIFLKRPPHWMGSRTLRTPFEFSNYSLHKWNSLWSRHFCRQLSNRKFANNNNTKRIFQFIFFMGLVLEGFRNKFIFIWFSCHHSICVPIYDKLTAPTNWSNSNGGLYLTFSSKQQRQKLIS